MMFVWTLFLLVTGVLSISPAPSNPFLRYLGHPDPANNTCMATSAARSTRCHWRCRFADSDFGSRMRTLTSKYRLGLLDLRLKHEKRVGECLHQTVSSTKAADLWMWFTSRTTPEAQDFQKSLEGHLQVGMVCSLRPSNDFNITRLSLNDELMNVLIEECKNSSVFYGSKTSLCYNPSRNTSLVCRNETTDDINLLTGEKKSVTWKFYLKQFAKYVMATVMFWYLPAIFCLFTPSEVETREGCIVYTLDGPSPVSIRGCLANVIFLKIRSTLTTPTTPMDFQTKLMFFLGDISFYVCLFLHYLLITTRHFDENTSNSIYIFAFAAISCNLRLKVIGWFWLLPARFQLLSKKEILYCFACAQVHKNYSPDDIEQHLRMQPNFVWKQCQSHVFKFKTFSGNCWKKLKTFCKPILPFIIIRALGCLIIGFIAIAYLVLCFALIIARLFSSSPLSIFVLSRECIQIYLDDWLISNFVYKYFTSLDSLNSNVILFICILIGDFLIILDLLVTAILRDFSYYLPFLIFGVNLAFNVWRCYRSFTREYEKLFSKLYKHYNAKTQGRGIQPVNPRGDSKNVLPKELFEEACKELMPLPENIGKCLVKIILIIICISVLFEFILETESVDDSMKASGTFLTALLPRIFEIFSDMSPEKEKLLELEVFDKNVMSVVDKYLTSAANRDCNVSSNNDGDSSTENVVDENLTSAANKDCDVSSNNNEDSSTENGECNYGTCLLITSIEPIFLIILYSMNL